MDDLLEYLEENREYLDTIYNDEMFIAELFETGSAEFTVADRVYLFKLTIEENKDGNEA